MPAAGIGQGEAPGSLKSAEAECHALYLGEFMIGFVVRSQGYWNAYVRSLPLPLSGMMFLGSFLVQEDALGAVRESWR